MWIAEGIRMKLLPVIKAFGCLCVLLADGFPVSEYDSPKIIGPVHNRVKALPGEQLLLHCGALTNCDDDEALIYWLVNGSFPEDTLSRDRIVETHESSLMEGSILLKSLLLKNVTLEDFDSTFSCVVTNTVGMAQKYIKLARTSGCSHRRVKNTEPF